MKRLARVKDLEVRLGVPIGSLEGTDVKRAKSALEDASALIRAEAGLCFSEVVPTPIKVLCVQVALRLYKYIYVTPEDGKPVISHSMGDFSERFADPNRVAATLTEDEKDTLRRLLGRESFHTQSAISNYYDHNERRRYFDEPVKPQPSPDWKKLFKLYMELEKRVQVAESDLLYVYHDLGELKRELPHKIKHIVKEAVGKIKVKPENIISGALSREIEIVLSKSKNRKLVTTSECGIYEEFNNC